jgi:asparagine synthase (glutamine-hydrolysing)
MCGLIAILNRQAGGWDTSSAEKAINRGLQFMTRRGLPGRSGLFHHKRASIGHVRLPIIDLSTESDQPYHCGSAVYAFVGEIFNYQELTPNARSDTQMIGEMLYEKRGNDFHKFDGFWSLVYIDENEAYAITDYLNQKPLYFHQQSTLIASEPGAIVAALDKQLTRSAVYFSNVLKWGYDPTGRTPYEEIAQLPAGHILAAGQEKFLAPYWDWSKVPYEANLEGLLIEATRNRLVGERPVGLLLSGGLDSTILFKILTEVLDHNVKVFHAENNESEYLEAALGSYPSQVLRPPPVTMEEAVIAHQVPVDLGSMVPQLALAKALHKEGFYVAMSGDGADEAFGGYRRAKEYDSQGSDLFVELPYYHLPRLDRLMMAETVELRNPYLAPKVIRHAMALPWHRRQSKEALKDEFAHLVPSLIINRPKLPLKTQAVMAGGIRYRQEVVDTWNRRVGTWSLK